jgi:peptidoglycan/LPS O-acetylase OafA/YrhL
VHAGVPGFEAGWLGVDLFFCLSGFLITTLLLNEWSENGSLALRRFWIRRFLRLMPAYYCYSIGITFGIWLWHGSVLTRNHGWGPVELTTALWAYFMNYVPMGGIWNGQILTVHLWSLSLEEQYYLIWPVTLWGLLKYPKVVAPTIWAITAASIAYFVFFASYTDRAYMLYGRGISLFFSSSLAVSLHHSSNSNTIRDLLSRLSANLLLMVAAILTLAAYFLASNSVLSEGDLRRFVLPELIVAYALAIARLWYGGINGPWRSILTFPMIVYIGKISYGIYLYHELIRIVVWWATKPWSEEMPRALTYVFRLALYSCASVGIAALSFQFLERRFLALKSRLH